MEAVGCTFLDVSTNTQPEVTHSAPLVPTFPSQHQCTGPWAPTPLVQAPLVQSISPLPVPAVVAVRHAGPEVAIGYRRHLSAPVQDLPKGALLVVAGHDALGNPAVLDESDLEVTFNPPEAVHEASIKVLPDNTVVICGLVQHEAESFVSVLGSKVRPPLPSPWPLSSGWYGGFAEGAPADWSVYM